MISEVVHYEACWKSKSDLVHLVKNNEVPPHMLLRPTGE